MALRRVSSAILAAVSILSGLSIPALPLSTAFFPRLGRLPLRLGHNRRVRAAQAGLVWAGALGSLALARSGWGRTALTLAPLFSAAAARFFPHTLLAALDSPARTNAEQGLTAGAPVLAFEHGGQVAAYPLDLLLPHHLVNDSVGGLPILVAW